MRLCPHVFRLLNQLNSIHINLRGFEKPFFFFFFFKAESIEHFFVVQKPVAVRFHVQDPVPSPREQLVICS